MKHARAIVLFYARVRRQNDAQETRYRRHRLTLATELLRAALELVWNLNCRTYRLPPRPEIRDRRGRIARDSSLRACRGIGSHPGCWVDRPWYRSIPEPASNESRRFRRDRWRSAHEFSWPQRMQSVAG